MSAPNFASILDEAPTEVKAPPPIPGGTYLFTVVGSPRYDKSARKGTPFVEFTLKLISPEADVDEEELADIDISNKTMRLTFYTTDDAVYRLDQFHEHCGIDLSEAASRRARCDAVINSQVRGVVGHRTSDDGTQIYSEIKKTLRAD